MRILALDYGAARIGCAISDPSGTLATPLSSLASGDPESVARLATEQRADRIVIGLPVSLDGSERGQAEETRRFGERLANLIDLPVEYYDERFTTVTAERGMLEAGLDAKQRRQVVDKVAAAVMLQAWLDHRKNTGAG